MKFFRTLFLVLMVVCLIGVAGAQTLTGYSNTGSLPNYNADGAYALLDEWMGLIDPNLDALPSARETEIYQEMVRAEGGISLVTSFDWNNKFADDGMYVWGVVSTIRGSRTRMELAKDLAWLPTALDHADELLALRDLAGTFSPNHGRDLQEPLWLSPHLTDGGKISPLNSGHNGTAVARFANWILENPDLYPQTAPSNSVIPLAVPTTYYERAKFYLTELKRSIEEEDLAGFFWQFDTTNNVGWVFQNGALDGSDLASQYPDGISVTNILSESNAAGIGLHPYNRVLYFLASRLETAKGLELIDDLESTSFHTAFINNAKEQSAQAVNYWRYHRVTHDEAAPAGTSHTWPYGASQDSSVYNEDSIHFGMDLAPLQSFWDAELLSNDDLEGTVGSIYSRWFDYESHVNFAHLGRYLTILETTGLPDGFWGTGGPDLLDWIGALATPVQMQGAAMKSLEVFRERMHRASFDQSVREHYLSRDDTRRSNTMKGPFELYNLKMTRHARGLTPTAGSNAPVIQSVSPSASFSISENTVLGTVLGSVSASDADAGQSVHYWISDGNVGNRFKINPTSGVIRVNNYYVLNDEEGVSTPLEITVMDDGVPVRMATTNITISLNGTNDSPLVPAGQTGRFTPNLIKGDPVMVVTASDASDLKFFIETSTELFTIDPDSGVVRIKDSAAAAASSIGAVYSLQIGVIEKTALPMITTETVVITCEAPFVNATASVSSGTVPFSVDFDSTFVGAGSLLSTTWDFGDGATAGTSAATHTYTMAGAYVITALVMDDRGELDRQSLQVTATGSGGTIPAGLLAQYRFSEGTGTTVLDSSGNLNHATLSADAYDADSLVGTGFELRDTGEVLTIPSSVYSVLSDEATISFFLKGDDDFHEYNTLFQAVDASGNRVLSSHMPWGGAGGSYIWDAGNNGGSFDRIQSSASIPVSGEWNHWVLTKNANTGLMAIYTNGVFLVSGSSKTHSMNGITNFKFGGNNFRGTIDEIQIYDKALNATEVSSLYAATSAGQNYALTYTASAHGVISGTASQTVSHGRNGTTVTVMPDAGYRFVQWSDGRTDNPRVDLNVAASLAVSATLSPMLLEQGLVADVANSSSSGWNGSVSYTVNDPFAYDPNDPSATLPVQSVTTEGFFGQLGDNQDAVLSYSLAGGALTLPGGELFVVDLYGRNLASATDRDDNIDIHLYSGGFGGTKVGSVTGVKIPDTSPYYVRTELLPTAAFDTLVVIGHDSNVSGNLFTLLEICTAAGTVSSPQNAIPVATADSAVVSEDGSVVITMAGTDGDAGDTLTYSVVTSPAHGTFVNSVYTPTANYNGTDRFTFVAYDGTASSAEATVSIMVNAVNDAPTAQAYSTSVDEDGSVLVMLLGSDIDGDSLNYSVATPPAQGTVNGSVYTPDADYNGIDSFTFTVSDGITNSAAATVSITVNAVNDAPVFNSDPIPGANATEDTAYSGSITASDVDSGTLSYTKVSGPAWLLVASDGSLSGMPASTDVGSNSFSVRVEDGSAATDTATLEISVSAAGGYSQITLTADVVNSSSSAYGGSVLNTVNDTFAYNSDLPTSVLPVQLWAADAGYHAMLSEGVDAVLVYQIAGAAGSLVVDLYGRDLSGATERDDNIDIELYSGGLGGTLVDQVTAVMIADSAPYHARAMLAPGSAFDTLVVIGHDTTSASGNLFTLMEIRAASSATLPNVMPIANADSVSVAEDGSVAITITGLDPEGSNLTYTVTTSPVSGTLSGVEPNLTYTPTADYNGTDSFTFVVNDQATNSTPATISITVNAVNDVPVANAASASVAEDGSVAITLTGSDIDGDNLSYNVVSGPAHGTYTGGIYTPNADYNGSDSFTFVASDVLEDSAEATVSITVSAVNDAPVANSDSATVAEDSSVAISMTGSDIDGDSLSYSVATQPANGSLSGTEPNLTYTPNADFNGADSFTFVAYDNDTNSAAETVSITVIAVNDAPVFTVDPVSKENATELAVYSDTLAGDAMDADSDPLTYSKVSGPSWLSIAASGALSGTPALGDAGANSWTVEVSDGSGGTDSATLNMIVDTAPVAAVVQLIADMANSSPSGYGGSVSNTVNDVFAFDPENPKVVLPVQVWSGAAGFHAQLSENVDAVLAYSLTGGALTLPVGGAFAVDLYGRNMLNDRCQDIDIELYSGGFGGTLVTSISGRKISLVSPYHVRAELTTTAAFDTVVVIGHDSTAASGNAFTLMEIRTSTLATASPANTVPVANADSVSVDEDDSVAFTLTGFDADDDNLNYTVATLPTNGSLSGTEPNLTYTPNANYNGLDSFTFVAHDNETNSAAATVSITVTAVNDAPVANDDSATVAEDGSVAIAMTGSDIDGDSLSYSVVSGPAHGTYTGGIYTPATDYNGSDSFTFRATDALEDSVPATISITVNAVNDSPVFSADPIIGSNGMEGSAYSGSIAAMATDTEGDVLTYSKGSGPTWLAVAADGSLSGTPASSDLGLNSFGVEVSDGMGGTDDATLNITVDAAPVVGPGIRVTEYYLTTGDFSGTSATVTLDQNLANDYYILVRGSRTGDASSYPDNNYARVSAVPGGKGELAASAAADQIVLSRFVADVDWEGVVTVVECDNSGSDAGFKLVDIVETTLSGTSGTDASATWNDANQVVLFGGYRGGGSSLLASAGHRNQGSSVFVRLYPSGIGTLNWSRNAAGETLHDAVMTTFVVEWGSEWNVQHVNVAGSNGGLEANATSEYTTAAISSVARDNSWVWATGTRIDAGIGDCAEACLVTLGDGVNQNASESTVAVGSEYSDDYDFDVYVLTHSDIAVDHQFVADGNQNVLDAPVAVDATISGTRFGWAYNSCNGTGTLHPREQFWARYTTDSEVTVSRGYDGQPFAAWVQGIDLSGLNN